MTNRDVMQLHKQSKMAWGAVAAQLKGLLLGYWRGSRGNVAVTMALLIVPLAGAVGLAGEGSSWLLVHRSMQHAADSAVIAAVTNGSTTVGANGDPLYTTEARAVASSYGYVNGANNTTVNVTDGVACPDGAGNVCYKVTIRKKVSLGLLQLVGYNGDDTVGGAPAQLIVAKALSRPMPSPSPLCILALDANSGDSGILVNGGPKSQLGGCSVFSNSNATCHGHDLGALYGGAVGSDDGCGITETSSAPAVADPYVSLASNILANPCGSTASAFPQEPSAAVTKLNGSYTSGSTNFTQPICGDVQLTGNVNITSGNAVLTIENGQLDVGNYTISTAPGAGLTVVFTGPTVSGLSPSHFITGGGTIDFNAPSSGTWSGVSIYQDPNLPSGPGVDFSYHGNSPTWNLSGLAYFPKANLTFKGAVSKSSNGYNCFVLVTYTLTFDGTADLFANTGQCSSAGLNVPLATIGTRAGLVS